MSKNNQFLVTLHAKNRFAERVSPELDIEDFLCTARECDKFESLGIDAEYVKFTGQPRKIRNNETYFTCDDIVFACSKEDVKKFLVQTCWLRPSKVEVEVEVEVVPEIEEKHFTMRDLVNYVESDEVFSIDRILEIIKNRPLCKSLKKRIKFIKRSNMNIRKETFMKIIEQHPLYKETYDRIRANPWQERMHPVRSV